MYRIALKYRIDRSFFEKKKHSCYEREKTKLLHPSIESHCGSPAKNEVYIQVEIWRVIFLHNTLLVPSSAPVRRLYNVIVGPKIFLEIVFVQQSLSCMIHQHTFGIPTFPCIS